MATYNLHKIQLGQESPWGTAVAATAMLMGFKDGSLTIEDVEYQTEQKGFLYPSTLVTQVMQSASGSFEYDLSYDDILYLTDGVFGDGSGATGNGAPYTWTYSAPTTAGVTPREYTMQFGPTNAEYEVEGCIFNEFTISGDVDGDGIWQAEVNFIGQVVTAETSHTLGPRVVELIRIADTVLSIDAVAGSIGTTPLTNYLVAFELNGNPGHHLKTFAGSINPTGVAGSAWEGTLSMTLEFATASKAYVDALLSAKVEKQIQIKATSGADSVTIQFAGFLGGPPELFGERDGNVVMELEWVGSYNATFANWLKIIAVNSIATLT